MGKVHVAASTQEDSFCRIPHADEIHLSDAPAYVHMTTNNTIYGTQWHTLPDVGDAPLVADMSSDVLSGPIDASRFALIYAGAQKSVGPAGVTLVVLRESWLAQASPRVPKILSYETHVKDSSLYNTPPAFGVYLVNLVLGWIEAMGGLAVLGERNREKARIIYDVIDGSGGFYRPHAATDSRSLMNITFRLASEAQEKQFLSEATAQGMVGLKGHRSVGGVRASVYNAMTKEGCKALASFMQHFAQQHG